MSLKTNIRIATLEDLEAIMMIEMDSFDKSIVEDSSVFRDRILTYNEGFLVLECEGSAVGYISSELWNNNDSIDEERFSLGHSISEYHDNRGTLLYISSLGVLKKYRGLGFGSMLFDYLIEKHKQLDSIILLVSPVFKRARAMYIDKDFKEIGVVKDAFEYRDRDTSGIIMRKNI